MIEAEWWDYDSVDEMADAVAGDIGFIIESALDARGEALIAVPGGKTPLPVFAKLADAILNWKKVTIIPTDERLVPLTDDKSNVRNDDFENRLKRRAALGLRALFFLNNRCDGSDFIALF